MVTSHKPNHLQKTPSHLARYRELELQHTYLMRSHMVMLPRPQQSVPGNGAKWKTKRAKRSEQHQASPSDADGIRPRAHREIRMPPNKTPDTKRWGLGLESRIQERFSCAWNPGVSGPRGFPLKSGFRSSPVVGSFLGRHDKQQPRLVLPRDWVPPVPCLCSKGRQPLMSSRRG